MTKYIDADTVVSMPFLDDSYGIEKHTVETDTIENLLDRFTKEGCPEPADVVPVSAYKQVMWERDIAVEQLKQIGKGLGEVMDDVVPVVFCKDCKFYTSMRPDIKTGICDLNVHHMGDDGFCSCGERRGEQDGR